VLVASAAASDLVTSGFYRMSFRRADGRWRVWHVYDGLDRPF
jgi:hypothetical protein